jgi:hypothetical protein
LRYNAFVLQLAPEQGETVLPALEWIGKDKVIIRHLDVALSGT